MSGKEKIKYLVRKRSIRYSLFLLIALLAITGMYMVAIASQVTGLVVTPDPIKLGTNAYLSYTLGQDANVTISVFKESGEHVKTLLNNIKRYAGSYTQSWDGKDAGGVLVPDGNYKFVVEARDAAGVQVGLAEKTVLAARQPAVSSITDTPDPFNPANGEQSTIQFTVSSDHTQTVSILKGYDVVRTWTTTQEIKGAGTYTWTWDGKDNNGNVVGDGAYTYQIEAASPTVSSFKSTYKGTANVEKEAPKITGITLTPSPLKISGSSMTIAYTLSENAKVTLKIVDAAGNSVRTVLNAVSKNAGYNSSAWDGKDSTGAYVPEGTYSVVISAVDNFSKSSGDQAVTFKAGYLPAISGAAVNPTTFDPNSGSAAISYNISKDALVTVQILSGYNTVRTVVDKQSQIAGSNSVAWNGRDDAGNIVGDGTYTVQITAVSAVVDTFFSTAKVTVTVEKGAPSVTGLTLSPEPYKLGTGSSLSISYNLSENGAMYIDVLKGTDVVRNLASGLAKNAGYNSTTWDGRDNDGSVVGEGIYTVRVKAVDPAGNAGEASANVTAGYQPSISNAGHSPDPYDQTSGNAAFRFDLGNSAKVTVTIMKGNMPVRTISAGVLASGTNTVVWDGRDDSANPAADGSYNYQIDAVSPTVDIFRSTFKGTITVEGAAPVLTNLSVSPYIVKIPNNAGFSYTLSEPATITAQVLTKTGAVVRDFPSETKTAGGYYTLAWDTRDNAGSLISSGDYIFKVSAVDNAGKTGSSQLAFQAGAVPVISAVNADPETVNVTTKGGQTTINFNISERSYVTVKVFDADGKVVRTLTAYQEMAAGSHSLSWDCRNDQGQVIGGTYTYKIDAYSFIGNFRALQASGTVEVTGAVGGGTSNCTDCHSAYPASHQTANCLGCHGNNEPISSIHSGTEDCAGCHSAHDSTLINSYGCAYCHNSDYSYKIPIHPADETALHTSTTLDTTNCGTCHQADVTKTHASCSTCHSSTDQVILGSISTGNTQCASCHRVQHNVNFAETVPADIPVYDAVYGGMTWTPPRDAFLWAGESWMPEEFVNGGKVVMSDRHTDLSGDTVFDFYNAQMTANGWTLSSDAPAAGTDFFTVTFTKGERKAVIWFYGGESHNASPVAESGYKIEIVYK